MALTFFQNGSFCDYDQNAKQILQNIVKFINYAYNDPYT